MDVDLVASGILEEDTVPVIGHHNDLSNFEGERCGICMDIIIDRGVLDCCQHWFCFACIDNWATITNLCPLCQSEFQLITCVPVYDTIGSNKVEDESFSRDDDWSIEGKSNTLSFPSYYIDENAVICLDGDGCKIRSRPTTVEGDPNLDTSIACDSCDIWYHAFCVGFDPEGTSEDTWLCPRCVANQAPKKSDVIPKEMNNNQHTPDIANGQCVRETALSGKLSVSVADVGETAIVVSMVGEDQVAQEPSKNFLSTLEVSDGVKIELSNSDGNSCDTEKPSCDKSTTPPILEGQELELSLSHNTFSTLLSNSLVKSELKTSKAAETIKQPSSLDGVGSSLGKSPNESYTTKRLSENESNMGLHLGLSIGSFLSVDDGMKSGESKDCVNAEFEHQSRMKEPSPPVEKIEPEPDNKENAGTITALKRKHGDFRSDVISSNGEETKCDIETEASEKKIRVEELVQVAPESQGNACVSDDILKCPTPKAVSRDGKLRNHPEKEDSVPSIMSIVQGTGRRTSSKGLGHRNPADEASKGENLAGLRVKKIMRRASEDNESSIVVQKLRKEIREAVRNKTSEEFGENLFDPKLLAAFRAAISGPKPETVNKLSPSAVKMKKSLLQKGKVRENLTKKIYGDSNGRRKRAWDRDCEVEFWKYRCVRSSKPEKIETLKSVLDLLRKNPDGTKRGSTSECQASNPILSRLYLADTSVFPRKDDIKPLSALKTSNSSEQGREQHVSVEKTPVLSPDIHTVKTTEVNKVSSKVGGLLTGLKGTKTSVLNSKGTATSSISEGSSISSSSNSKVKSQKEVVAKSEDAKIDKRKLALAVLARKKAAESKNGTQERQEDNALLKGNYPLLAQLPVEMRPSLAPSRHNKIPVSVRQTQLYRLTEHFLRKTNLSVMRRTAETELAVADAINIEREVADRSNSKVVYLNLCSQEILHRSDDNKGVGAKESDTSSPSEISIDGQDQGTGECSTDPAVEEALRNAGLLSDSPPNSPHHKAEVTGVEDDSSAKIKEEEPDNVFEMDSHLEEDIYGDFEYDLEDEDYIGVSAEKAPKLQPEEGVSKMKVVFSTLSTETSKPNDVADSVDNEKIENLVVPNDSSCFLKNNTDAVIKCSTVDDGTDRSCAVTESLPNEEAEDLSIAECEELYGPDKEPLINKFSEASQKIYGVVDTETLAENCTPEDRKVNASDPGIHSKKEGKAIDTFGHGSSDGASSADQIQTGENIKKKDKKSNTETDKQSDGANHVSKKVEAYIKEHIRPLCKSGVITVEQYRFAVAKTTEKVMKYHTNSKNANFLIKEGEKVKKLAEKYIETAQQKEKSDPL
ncbi:Zinc finger, RING-type [Corchorus capsularis]|uniref:Zinc finger, RING-type n=1 Tax=Corchorus capsularis TaxID=210143 RepID=A0A1R3IB09_COCAP|nr:Zinc finger, RING-type [Corchorus capsularis]